MRVAMLLISCIWCCLAQAATFYVRTDGNNANNGLVNTSGGAFLTIGKLATVMASGDVGRIQAGTYAERVTIGADGSPGSLITYVCDGQVICQGFSFGSHNYNMVIGFEVTGPVTQEAFDLPHANNNQIIDCNVHDISSPGVRFGDGSGLTAGNSNILRGTIITNVGFVAGINSASAACIYCLGTNNLMEYNQLGRCSDFISSSYASYRNIARNNVMRDTQESYYNGAAPHVDLWETQPGQTNASYSAIQNMFERNYASSNMVNNGHFGILQSTSQSLSDAGVNVRRWIGRLNAMRWFGSGGQGPDGYPEVKLYNNTHDHFSQNLGGNANNGNVTFIHGATNGLSINNIYTFLAGTLSYTYNTDASTVGNLVIGADDVFGGGYLNPSEASGMTNDPSYANTSAGDLHLQAGSPLIGKALPQTKTSGTGSGATVVTVLDSLPFCDGWSVPGVVGDSVIVSGNAAATIVSINYANNQITFASNLTWTNNAPVYLVGTVDIGALPYGSQDLTNATMVKSGTTYTVTPGGDAREVWFYVDGIPTTNVTSAPFSTTISSGTVTAKAYALYAQANPVVTASLVSSATASLNLNSATMQLNGATMQISQ